MVGFRAFIGAKIVSVSLASKTYHVLVQVHHRNLCFIDTIFSKFIMDTTDMQSFRPTWATDVSII